jgi:hypothetical protein
MARWLGGVAMLAIYVVPFVLLTLAHRGTSVTIAGGTGWRFIVDYGWLLSETPAALTAALLAPVVGYRRRVALWFLFPPVGVYFAWVIGGRAGELGGTWTGGVDRRTQRDRRTDRGTRLRRTRAAAVESKAEALIREGLAR